MDFKTVKTYGRFRNRVIKTDLWISPQVQRARLFVSTSSESSNSSANRSEQDLAVSVGSEPVSESSSSGTKSSPAQYTSSEEKSFNDKNSVKDSSRREQFQLSSLENDNNSPAVVEHSTPFSSCSLVTVRPRRLIPVISPLVASESPLNPTVGKLGQFDSPNLFSDASQEHCDSSANENEDSYNTTNEDETRFSTANKSSTASEGETNCSKPNEEGSSCNIDWTNELNERDLSLKNGISTHARTSLEMKVELQKLSSDDIQNISDRMKHLLSLNDSSPSSNSSANVSHEMECHTASTTQNKSTENQISGLLSHVSNDNSGLSPENQSGNPDNIGKKEQSFLAKNEITNQPGLSTKKEVNLNSKNVSSLKKILHHNHLDSMEGDSKSKQDFSNSYESETTQDNNQIEDLLAGSRSSNARDMRFSSEAEDQTHNNPVVLNEMHAHLSMNSGDTCRQSLSNEVKGNSVDCTCMETNYASPSMRNHSATEQRQSHCGTLHDEYIQDCSNPIGTRKASNGKELAHSAKQATSIDAISKKLKELRLLDAKVYLDRKEGLKSSSSDAVTNHANMSAPKNSLNGTNMSPSGDVHPSTHSENDIPPLPASAVLLIKEITPKNADVHTPMSDQGTDDIVKNPNYSSFVEALTPARFQRSRKRPLTPKEKILVQCGQQKPLKFTEVLSPSALAKCVKVGEGTYGEVYKTRDGVEDVALKVIPIEGNFTVNDEPQKSFEEMIPEIVISKELCNLADCDDFRNAVNVCSNFIKVKRVMLVQDGYPEKLLQEWDRWKNNHNCENERPDMFEPDQYFVVFEFIDGGEDLERFQFTSMDEALSVLQQVALSLSVAEQALLFEHRDLHWGNVLIKRSNCKTVRYKLCGQDIHVKSAGVFVSIIDFTLSRLTKDGMTVFCDLSKDPDIFKGKGDYQFQVYRLMRKANNNNWESHEPYSNVLWVRYLLDKILNTKKYKKANNGIQRNLRTYLRQVLTYESAVQAVQDGFLGIHVSSAQQ